jgi:Tol biopolymer transport system component
MPSTQLDMTHTTIRVQWPPASRRWYSKIVLLLVLSTVLASGAAAIQVQSVYDCSQDESYVHFCVLAAPALSPDGRCVAFEDMAGEVNHLVSSYIHFVGIGAPPCVVSVDPVVERAPSQEPAWSLDGSRFAYVVAAFSEQAGIWAMQVGDLSHPPTSLVHVAAGFYHDPVWSPDGGTIACTGSGGVYVVPSTGGVPSLVAAGGQSPSWGPDGRIVFARDGDLWIRSREGSEHQLTRTPEVETEPTWCPHGTWIAYVRNQQIWIIASTGGTPVQVTTGPALAAHPAWSASCDRLAYVTSESVLGLSTYGISVATDLPDWTIGVELRTWSDVKRMYR